MDFKWIVLHSSDSVAGLNVYSMLKHETVVLTLAAVEKIEEKLLKQMHKQDFRDHKFLRQRAHLQVQPHLPAGVERPW